MTIKLDEGAREGGGGPGGKALMVGPLTEELFSGFPNREWIQV